MQLSEAVIQYLTESQLRNYSVNTIKNKRNFCRRLLTFLGDRELTITTGREFLQSIIHLREQSRLTETVALKAFITFLFERKVISENFGSELRLPKIHSKPYQLISIMDAERVVLAGTVVKHWYNKLAKQKQVDMRIALLFILHTGLRISEIRKLRSADFMLSSATPQFNVCSKGGNTDVQPLDSEAIKLIRPLLSRDLLFPIQDDSCNRALTRGTKKLKIDVHITCHSLRHIYANELNANQAAPQKIQRLMRHRKFATTDRYYLHNDVRDLANITSSYNSLSRRNLTPHSKLELLYAEIHRLGLDSDPDFVLGKNSEEISIKIIAKC